MDEGIQSSACNVKLSGSFRECPGNVDCFISPSTALSFHRFAPCFRKLAEEEGTWINRRPVQLTDQNIVHVVWHVRVGDIEPHKPGDGYYKRLIESLEPLLQDASSSKHYVLADWEHIDEEKLTEFKRDFWQLDAEFLSLSIEDAFLYFLHADILIGGGSSFPRVATLFSTNLTYVNSRPYHGWGFLAEFDDEGVRIDSGGTIVTPLHELRRQMAKKGKVHKFHTNNWRPIVHA